MDKKRKKINKQKKADKKKQQLPHIKLAIHYTNATDQFKIDMFEALEGVDFGRSFWATVPMEWRRAAIAHRNRTQPLSKTEQQSFARTSSKTVEELLAKILCDKYPKYKAPAYFLSACPAKFLEYVVRLHVLKSKRSSQGLLHLIPNLKYPSNKKLALSTHALKRMETRLFGENVPYGLGFVLRRPMILIPYNKNIYALYAYFSAKKHIKFAGKPRPFYILMGYLPIIDKGKVLFAKTHLTPGFHQTPEDGIPENQIAYYRIITIINGVIHRVTSTSIIDSTIEPYNTNMNPNIKMLYNIERMLRVGT